MRVPRYRKFDKAADVPPRSEYRLVPINALLGSNTLIEIWLPSAHIELLEEAFDVGDVVGAAVGWQGFEEDFAVAGGADAGVEEHEDSAV